MDRADRDRNIFLTMGKYVTRQNENLLTQSLATLYNHCQQFRIAFMTLLQQRGSTIRLRDGYAVTKASRPLGEGRIVVDLEIFAFNATSPSYVLDVKVGAPFTRRQARRYAQHITARGGEAQLVVVNRMGVDSELQAQLPEDTLWITWAEIGALVKQPRRGTTVERFMRGQFHSMLEAKGIPMLSDIAPGRYAALRRLNRFVGKSRSNLHVDTLATISQVVERMQLFTDTSAPTA